MDEREQVKLEACPLCGVEDGDHDEGTPFLWAWEGDEGWYVACGNCGCRGGERETEAKAIEAWNQRSAKPIRGEEKWSCQAKKTADPPQDCGWPTCGCDPYANKVLEILDESNPAVTVEELARMLHDTHMAPFPMPESLTFDDLTEEGLSEWMERAKALFTLLQSRSMPSGRVVDEFIAMFRAGANFQFNEWVIQQEHGSRLDDQAHERERDAIDKALRVQGFEVKP